MGDLNDNQEHFARLRSLLGGESTQANFVQILQLLASWESKDLLLFAVDYAEEHLASWEDESRFARELECWDGIQENAPWLRLIKAVRFCGMKIWDGLEEDEDAEFLQLVQADNLCSLKSLGLESFYPSEEALHLFACTKHFSGLEKLSFFPLNTFTANCFENSPVLSTEIRTFFRTEAEFLETEDGFWMSIAGGI